MMTDKKPEIKYSEPVREIMGTLPGRILKWGTTLIFSVFVLFILIAWFVKYPDLIPSQVEITTKTPPVTLVSKISGRIKHLYVADKSSVAKGQMLAVMETAASMSEISYLRQFLDSVSDINSLKSGRFPDLAELGELQIYYGTLKRNLTDLDNFNKNDYYGNRIKATKDEIAGLKTYINRLKENEHLFTENLSLESNKFKRDSLLSTGKTIADADYEKSKQALLRQKIDLQQVRLELSAKNIELTNKQQLITEYSIQGSGELEKLTSSAEESFYNLKAQMKIWENRYLLVSPVEGTVTFTKYWSENQSVNVDEPVISIVPPDQGKYIGRIFLKMQRSGKVKVGQIVNIKLSSFPYLEYGMVQGKVKTKSLVTSEDAYVIEIELTNGLTTLYGKKLDFTQNMQGTAEIITEDRRLLEKILSPFRYLLTKNRRSL
jgi:multidrug efflux pump subunit AcrA (membrane-fusion protein)